MDSTRDCAYPTYLDTAAYGLPSTQVRDLALEVTREWARGSVVWLRDWEPLADDCRRLAAGLLGLGVEGISLVPTVSVASAYVAWSLPRGAVVLAADNEFRSVLYPFMARERRGEITLRLLPRQALETYAEHVDLLAVSHVESADGHVNDVQGLTATAHGLGGRIYVDATHAVGTLPPVYAGVDHLAVTAYKWLCSPRGVSFLYTAPHVRPEMVPLATGWRSSPGYHDGAYFGGPLDLFEDGRGLDVSVAWQPIVVARGCLQEIHAIPPQERFERGHRVVGAVAEGLGLAAPAGTILSVPVTDPAATTEALKRHGVKTGVQGPARRVRLSAHFYNTHADVEPAVAALRALVDRRRTPA